MGDTGRQENTVGRGRVCCWRQRLHDQAVVVANRCQLRRVAKVVLKSPRQGLQEASWATATARGARLASVSPSQLNLAKINAKPPRRLRAALMACFRRVGAEHNETEATFDPLSGPGWRYACIPALAKQTR